MNGMNDNKRKNSDSIIVWLEKLSKSNMNDPIPNAVTDVTKVNSDEYSSTDFIY